MSHTVVELSRDERDGAVVVDLVHGSEGAGDVEAYLVEPGGERSGAAVLFLHWFDPEAPDGNRTQYLTEAIDLASAGVVSLLPQGAFPWDGAPSDSASDIARIESHLSRIRAGLDLLADRADDGRIGVVAHDFGAMFGALLASRDGRPTAYALIAGTPRWGDWFLPFWEIDEDRHDYLKSMAPHDPIEHVAQASPAEILFQFASDDFYVARMTALEFARAAAQPKSIEFYPADHAMRSAEARDDRRSFLARTLGF
jgi:dienelactone hydrolase